MDAEILQNSADPEATFHEKAGKQNRGYVANVTEASGENGSIVTDYQYEQNTYSDSQFLKDALETMGKQQEAVTIVTDGAYPSDAARELAETDNVTLEATNLTGRKAENFLANFGFNESGTRVVKCPGGHTPKSCSCNSNGQCTVSFHRSQCESCPYMKQCHPKVNKRTCRKLTAKNQSSGQNSSVTTAVKSSKKSQLSAAMV